MATTTSTQAAVATIEGDQCVDAARTRLEGLSHDAPAPGRASDAQDDLSRWETSCLVSPSYIHERLAERLGMFVIEVVVGLRASLACRRGAPRSVAGRRKRVSRGTRPYYLANAAQIHGKTRDRSAHRSAARPRDRGCPHPRGSGGGRGLSPASVCPRSGSATRQELQILVRQANGRYARVGVERGLPVSEGDRDLRMGHASPRRRPIPSGRRNSAAGSATPLSRDGPQGSRRSPGARAHPRRFESRGERRCRS